MTNKAFLSAAFRLATADDSHLDTYDNTKLQAYNVCPTWGVLRYAMHKRMPHAGRAMALEAGTAMHEVFAYCRLMKLQQQLMEAGYDPQPLVDHHAVRLFGQDRWTDINAELPTHEAFEDRTKIGCLNVLDTGGFYDDDRDKRRTLTNLQTCALTYVDRWDWRHNVWVRDLSDPSSDVGIEIPFDIYVETSAIPPFRFTGMIDGIRWHGDKLTIEDNKTASRLNDAWEMSFETSSQITGYCLAASVFAERAVRNAEAIGLAIPIPRSEFNGYNRAIVQRTDEHFNRWIAWVIDTVTAYRSNTDPTSTLQYTHSCNRYFRPCSFIPFCAERKEDQQQIIAEMEDHEWSPLHKVGDTEGD